MSMQTDWRLWALGSALFAAATAILAKVGVAGISSNLATAIRTCVVFCFTVGVVCATGEHSRISRLGARTWLFLVLSGLATGCSWLCYFRALQLGEAAQVAPLDKLSVIFVMVLAAVFLREKLSWQQWAGGMLIFGGALLMAWRPR